MPKTVQQYLDENPSATPQDVYAFLVSSGGIKPFTGNLTDPISEAEFPGYEKLRQRWAKLQTDMKN